ncbi:MAG TPA: HisA/HisF-related TIM barrel protein [Candidatus Limnocylindrales bacterium]|nr:HisA/HisF-related TIM barrel protein [Candidatus Limnocylindrales bacterium]
MQVIPSLDIQGGRSRLVWWPGASTGVGTPTDRPSAIAESLVAQGATIIHLVDLDGAQRGRPVNLEAIAAVARAVATPLQLAGGIDGPEQIEMAFAAGATRVVMPLWAIVEDPARLAASLRIGGDWLAVGLDARPESLHGYPWRHRPEPRLDELVIELVAAGVRRFVVSHVPKEALSSAIADGSPIASLRAGMDAQILVAGGVSSLADLEAWRGAGVDGVIVGEALFTGSIDLQAAQRVVG